MHHYVWTRVVQVVHKEETPGLPNVSAKESTGTR